MSKKLAIIGVVGVPARYGGFETLAEKLVRYHKETCRDTEITVWCSKKECLNPAPSFENADLSYVNLRANGIQSIPYDVLSLWQAVRSGHDQVLLLGVSGALALLFKRFFSDVRIVTNIDGIEWKREKWGWFPRLFLRACEWSAVTFSDAVIADNQAIAEHVNEVYGRSCDVIAYGGDHALHHTDEVEVPEDLPDSYALALCRIEPENNVHVLLEAMEGLEVPLVFVGNWDNSCYGRELKTRYTESLNIFLLDPVYDPDTLYAIRSRASVYLHGHSAGGTNPSLVEMMHFGIPIFAHDCVFNRYSTEGNACYFATSAELAEQLLNLDPEDRERIGCNMLEVAQRKFTWDKIGKAYFELLERA